MTSATLSREEAARYLGIGQRLFDSLYADGKIPSLMLGNRRLFRRETLDKLLAEREAQSKRPNLRAVRP